MNPTPPEENAATLQGFADVLSALADHECDASLLDAIAALRAVPPDAPLGHALGSLLLAVQRVAASTHDATREIPGVPLCAPVLADMGARIAVHAEVLQRLATVLKVYAEAAEETDDALDLVGVAA